MLAGPEYFTIFDGLTGAALATTDYIPGREPQDGWGGIGGNGGSDDNGNSVDRFLAGVAYLDGRLPSVIMARGYYGRTRARRVGLAEGAAHVALGVRFGQRAAAVSESRPRLPTPARAITAWRSPTWTATAGTRSSTAAMVVDDNGKGLFSTGLRHGDALHVGDLDPARPGLEVFGIHENEEATVALGHAGACAVRARGRRDHLEPAARRRRRPRAGRRHRSAPSGRRVLDVGAGRPARRRAAHASPTRRRRSNFAVWWDADPLREILDSNWIAKWDWRSSHARPAAHRDRRLVEQRHQVHAGAVRRHPRRLARGSDLASRRQHALRIYTTTIPAADRIYTLMHDPQYRVGDRLAERRLQPAAAPELLPRRRHDAAAAPTHHRSRAA